MGFFCDESNGARRPKQQSILGTTQAAVEGRTDHTHSVALRVQHIQHVNSRGGHRFESGTKKMATSENGVNSGTPTAQISQRNRIQCL